MTILSSWPPPVILRRSKRAKYIRITIDAKKGLQLVYPYFLNKNAAWQFLESKRAWIESHQNLMIAEQVKQDYDIPLFINLSSINKNYHTVYRYLPKTSRANVRMIGNELVFCGETKKLNSYDRLLKKWLKLQAETFLTAKLQALANQTNLNFISVTYRQQKTLWGSCTRNHHISLNIKLLFLPEALTDYVMLHELCHTRYLNHSAKFWNLLNSYLPNCYELDKLLKLADKFIPEWYKFSE